MFCRAQPTFYPSYDPYEQLLLQQELQRSRQVEAYLQQRREAEELERRRAYEHAVLQAAYERRREAEFERRRRAEVERRQVEQARRHLMFDGGMQELFDAIYGRPVQTREEQDVALNEESVPRAPAPTPTTPSAPQPEPSGPENDQIEDATPQIDTAPSLAAVQSVLASFASLQSSFTLPEYLDFLPSSKLAYTPNNAPLHAYEHTLTGLLTRLDAVESFGNDEVRKFRKEAVKSIELELEKLDRIKAEAWKKQSGPAPEPETASPEPSELGVDPVTIPLPHDPDESVFGDDSETVVGSTNAGAPISAESARSPVFENLQPLPASPEPLSRSLSSPTPSESSDSEPGMELEEYVDVEDVMSGSETEVEEEAVEKDEDLELMRDWDIEF